MVGGVRALSTGRGVTGCEIRALHVTEGHTVLDESRPSPHGTNVDANMHVMHFTLTLSQALGDGVRKQIPK